MNRFYPLTHRISPYLFITTLLTLLFLIVPDFNIITFGTVLLAHYINRVIKETLIGDWLQFSKAIRYFIYALTAAIFYTFNTWESYVLLMPFVLLEILMDHDENLDYCKMQIFTISLSIITIGILYLIPFDMKPKLTLYGIFLCGLLVNVFIERYLDHIQSFHLVTVPVLFIIIPTYVFYPEFVYLLVGFIPVTCETHNHIKIPGLKYFDPDKEES